MRNIEKSSGLEFRRALQPAMGGAAASCIKYFMTLSENDKTGVEQAGENLFDFAVDREDIKIFVEHLSEEAKCKPTGVEYELQLLKIVSTGWSISFFLKNSLHGKKLAENFWKKIYAFSAELSETTSLMTGHDIDYFQILKNRLDGYVNVLQSKPEMTEPAAAIGPEFARLCGDADDVFTIMAGSRIFILTVARVREYLDSLGLD